jgi:hypothetical protein
MTIFYSGELAGIASLPLIKAANAAFGARLRRYRGSVTLAAQTTSDTIVIGQAPAGASFAYGVLTSSVSLGTSTIASKTNFFGSSAIGTILRSSS